MSSVANEGILGFKTL